MSQSSLVERYKLSPRAFTSLLKVLDKTCDTLSRRIEAHAGKLGDLTLPESPPARNHGSRSPTKSPIKSSFALSNDNSSPSKPPTRRRKIEATNSTFEDDDTATAAPESPTKRRKLTAQRPKEVLPSTSNTSSPIRDPLDAMSRDFEGRVGSISDAEMEVVDQSPINASPKVGPSTLSPGKKFPVQVSADDDAMEVDLPQPEKSIAGELRPKCFRRVFLDQQQWLSRDSSLVREWQRAEAHKRSMMALYGHPFENYRPRSTSI